MKKTSGVLFFVLCLLSSNIINLYAQGKDASDYFAIGLYGGSFKGQGALHGHHEFINSASLEIEYFKLENLSFYLQGLYKFTGSDNGHHQPIPYLPLENNMPPQNRMNNSDSHLFNLTFGGRYYLRSKVINPFFQLGINHLSQISGGHRNLMSPGGINERNQRSGFSGFNLAINPGVGLSIKLSNKFNAELKYDLLIGIVNSPKEFNGYSLLCGLKYKL